jgi:hypothetical protein
MCGRRRSSHRMRNYFGVYLAELRRTTIPITTIVTIIAAVSRVIIVINFRVLGNVRTLEWVLRTPSWRERMYKIWVRGTKCIFPISFLMSQI